MWKTYGVPPKAKKGSRKTGKRGRFERYNDEVDYGEVNEPGDID